MSNKKQPPIGGLSALANGKATAGIYKKAAMGTEVLVVEFNIEEYPNSSTKVGTATTKIGTPVVVYPTHCTWTFEDTNGRVYVGISCLIPSSVGITNAHLDANINNKVNVLQVHMIHPKLWSTMKFVD
jgi:hypothetical protein